MIRVRKNAPSSYSSCATDMLLEGFILSFLEHSCCRVEVMKGTGGLREAFLSVTLLTLKWMPSSAVSQVITECATSLLSTTGSCTGVTGGGGGGEKVERRGEVKLRDKKHWVKVIERWEVGDVVMCRDDVLQSYAVTLNKIILCIYNLEVPLGILQVISTLR